jgi:hypothetical protein
MNKNRNKKKKTFSVNYGKGTLTVNATNEGEAADLAFALVGDRARIFQVTELES